MWQQLPWRNEHEEVYTRLVPNGLPLAGRMPSCPRPCCWSSGGDHPDHRHHFWGCPVAGNPELRAGEGAAAELGGRAVQHCGRHWALPEMVAAVRVVAAAAAAAGAWCCSSRSLQL